MQANLNAYWLLLKDLSFEDKVALIEKLLQSLKPAKAVQKKQNDQPNSPKPNDWIYEVNGSWKEFPESAEDMISLIENARTMGRTIEPL